MPKILLIGDRSEDVIAHRRIPKALTLAATDLGVAVEAVWVPTRDIFSTPSILNLNPTAIWCVPGSPYVNMEGALTAIRVAREGRIPFLGTCGGFQHALIEYARNVLGIKDADHAESNPAAITPVISKLQCALINKSETIQLKPGSMISSIYGATEVREDYHCNYGVNPQWIERLQDGHLQFTAFGLDGDIRALEIVDTPFFMATLFQPERSAITGKSHPLIRAFLKAASAS